MSSAKRVDIVSLLDEFATNFYQELDYELECANGIRLAEEMRVLPSVKIPVNYPCASCVSIRRPLGSRRACSCRCQTRGRGIEPRLHRAVTSRRVRAVRDARTRPRRA